MSPSISDVVETIKLPASPVLAIPPLPVVLFKSKVTTLIAEFVVSDLPLSITNAPIPPEVAPPMTALEVTSPTT